MRLSKTELIFIAQLAERSRSSRELMKTLKRSASQIWRMAKSLERKGLIIKKKRTIEPAKTAHTTLLLHLLDKHPHLVNYLADSGIPLLTANIEKRSINDIMAETGFKRAIIFRKIAKMKGISLMKNNTLNGKIWPDVKEFIIELKKYENISDFRVSQDAIIYYKTEKEIIFSSKRKADAVITAFSAYNEYGIKLYSPTTYYYLPKRKLNKKDIFVHSLIIAEKENSIQHIILAAIFYAKFKNELSQIMHPLLAIIKRVLAGERVAGYPSNSEIQDRGEIYDIEI